MLGRVPGEVEKAHARRSEGDVRVHRSAPGRLSGAARTAHPADSPLGRDRGAHCGAPGDPGEPLRSGGQADDLAGRDRTDDTEPGDPRPDATVPGHRFSTSTLRADHSSNFANL